MNQAMIICGRATVFGLNYDGSTDREDNGLGAFGRQTANKTILGASLPVPIIKESIGDHRNAAIAAAIRKEYYTVFVTNRLGKSINLPIVDVGPAVWTHNLCDLTYAAAHYLQTNGADDVTIQLLHNGASIPIKGFPDNTFVVDWQNMISQIPQNENRSDLRK
jgi:hypothetical protein